MNKAREASDGTNASVHCEPFYIFLQDEVIQSMTPKSKPIRNDNRIATISWVVSWCP